MSKELDTNAVFESLIADTHSEETSNVVDTNNEDSTAAFEQVIGNAIEQVNSSIAVESLMCPGCVNKLLEKASSNITSKCTTVTECDAMMETLKVEIQKFNDCLGTMSAAAKEFKNGAIAKEELSNKISPCLAELRQSCDILKIGDDTIDNNGDVTDEDVANLSAFIAGVREIISKRRAELDTPPAAPENCSEEKKTDAPDQNARKEAKADESNTEEMGENMNNDENIELLDPTLESAYFDADEDIREAAFESAFFDMALEGANIQAMNIAKDWRKNMKVAVREFKAAKKEKDYKKAAEKAKECAELCSKGRDAIDKLPNSVSSAILGDLAYTAGMTLTAALSAGIGAGIAGTVVAGAKAGVAFGTVAAASAGGGAAVGSVLGIGAGTAIGKLITKKAGTKFTANDANMLITCIHNDLSAGKVKWTNAANKMNDLANKSATESSTLNVEGSVAEEGTIKMVLRANFGFDAKETKAVVKDAKDKAKAKDFDGAIAGYKKAKAMYEKALKKLEAIPDKKIAVYGKEEGKSYETDSFSKTAAINGFRTKITKMMDCIDKLQQAKKKAASKAATESATDIDIFGELGVDPACESDIDIFDELGVDPVIESVLDEVEDDSDETLDDILAEATSEVTDNTHVKSDPSATGPKEPFQNVVKEN